MKPRSLASTALVAVMSYALAACPPPANNSRTVRASQSSGSARREVTPVSPRSNLPARTGAVSGSVAAPEGVTAVTERCANDRPETCNGLDDNCDGVIDNNCGYAGGGIQITVAWRGAADLDLHVTDPANEEVYFGHRQAASGGQMDQDANGECAATRPTIENVRWATPSPPAGTYQVRLQAFDLCGATDATATVSVSVGGRIVGAWTVPFTYPRQEYVFPLTVQ